MKKAFTYLLLLSAFALHAQVEGDQKVISSGGSEYNSPALNVSSTIGETIITTEQSSAVTLTQGFQQTFDDDSIVISVTTFPASCEGRDNGFAILSVDTIIGCDSEISQIIWSAGTPVVGKEEEVRNLAGGQYTVQIVTQDNCSKMVSFEIGYEKEGDCILEFFSGITPNGDGVSDVWKIENIEAFPTNKVTIFNRLGNIVFEEDNYDNVNVVWDGTNVSGRELSSDTYFFVFEANGEFEKGWIELTRF